MTGYCSTDRFYDALSGKPKDRVPFFPLLAPHNLAPLSHVSIDELFKDPDRFAEVAIRGAEELGLDYLLTSAKGLDVPLVLGCKMEQGLKGGMPTVYPLSLKFDTMDDVDQLRIPDLERDGAQSIINQIKRLLNEHTKGNTPILSCFEGPFTTVCRLLDASIVMRMAMKKRGLLEAILDRVNQILIEMGQLWTQNGVSVILIPEPTASSSMISHRQFSEMVLPRLQRLTSSLDKPCILHICGDTTPVLEMMAQTGAAVLSLDQCMDLKVARDLVPDAVLGDKVDPVESLLLGKPEKVAEDTLDCLRSAGVERFVLMSGCQVPPEAPLENMKIMGSTASEYGLGE